MLSAKAGAFGIPAPSGALPSPRAGLRRQGRFDRLSLGTGRTLSSSRIRTSTWESKATFNPAALFDAGKVHLLYRAIGDSDVSVLGHASSEDGRRFERSKAPAYQPREAFEGVNPGECRRTGRLPYFSGGGGRGGCEDPRLAQIGDRVYLIFTAFNGWDSIRIALTSIGVDDFRSQRWNWAKPVLISPPGEIHKNWVLFPEKIGGKYAILHSISPEILVRSASRTSMTLTARSTLPAAPATGLRRQAAETSGCAGRAQLRSRPRTAGCSFAR